MTLCEKMEVANEQLRCGVVFLETVNVDRLSAIPTIEQMETDELKDLAIALGELIFNFKEKGEEL